MTEPQPPSPQSATQPPRPRRRRALRFAAAAAAALLALALAAWVLAGWSPAWAHGPAGTPDDAAAVENAVVRHMTAPRDGARTPQGWRSEPWSVSISQADARAWLAHRLEPWAANRGVVQRWPADVSRPTVSFDQGRVRVGVMVRGRLIHAAVVPRVDDQGRVWLEGARAGIGLLPLPAGAWDLLPSSLGVPAWVGDWAAGARGVEGVVPLEGRRRVRIESLVAREGRLEVTCRTEVAPDAPGSK
jgi:hypothetical protein